MINSGEWGEIDHEALADSERAVREIERIVGLQSDPLANIDMLLSLIAADMVDPSIASGYIAGLATRLENQSLSVELYPMWAELSDLHDFTPEDSEGERAVVATMKEAAVEWGQIDKRRDATLRAYFEKWSERRDLKSWKSLLGGATFGALDAAGWFRWSDLDTD